MVPTAHLQTRFSAVQVGHEVLPVLSGSVHFCPNRLHSVFGCHDRNQLAARDHGVQLGLTLISVTEELLSREGKMWLNKWKSKRTDDSEICLDL